MNWTMRNWNVQELNYSEEDHDLMVDEEDREDLLRERQFVPSMEVQQWYQEEVKPGANCDPLIQEALETQLREVKSSLQWVGRAQTRVQNLMKKMPKNYYQQVYYLLVEQYEAFQDTFREIRKLEEQIKQLND